MKYVRECNACQRFGPLKPSKDLKSILYLQPMDMWGMDFIGPIKPKSTKGQRYILIVVDYFTRYLFTRATINANREEVMKTLMEITKYFGWPKAIYCDNASYFVKG